MVFTHHNTTQNCHTYAAKWIHPPAVKLSNWTTSVRIHTHLHLPVQTMKELCWDQTISFSKLERSVLNSHTCTHLCKNWRDPPAQQSLQIWHFLQGVCGFGGHFLHLHQRFDGIQSVTDGRGLTQRRAHPLLQKTFACDTIFIRQWYSNVLRNWSWSCSIHTGN